jgi:DNA polymerase-3 subunit alpha
VKVAEFVHLHSHTEYSLLDGAARIKPLCELAAQYRMPGLAITDHGNLFGAVEFYRAAQGAGVKPVMGCEVYVAPGSRAERRVDPEVAESSFHLTLLCESLEGYRNLVKLVSLGYLEGFYYRPRIDLELLAEHHRGLIALSGCLKGEVSFHLARGSYEKARAAAGRYREIMGAGNFLLEVMRVGVPECEKVEAGLVRLGEELGLGLVATNDCHYLQRRDYEAHEALLCLQTGKRLKDKARLRFGTEECYLKSPEEMARVFRDRPDWLTRTVEVAGRCNVLLDEEGRTFKLPQVKYRPAEFDSDYAFLRAGAREGLARRFARPTAEARDRLEHELEVIGRMGFAGYFLIVQDIVNRARAKGIPVGPGRGSAVGSLVLYALGITDVDPLRYGLIFERFLTQERVSLPDIDVDFADSRRGEVIADIRSEYGAENVAQIITFGTMGAKAAVRDVGRVLDVPLAEVDRLAKLIPFDATLAAALTQSKELKALVNSRPEYQKIWEIASRLEGVARHASIHASGVVITPRPLIELVPLYKSSDGDVCTQYDMNSLETMGLLKMDVLGLRTLTVVDSAVKLLHAGGIELDTEELPLDDARTYELLKRADVTGVFQLESAGMQNLLVRTQPENLEDIMAVISLYRPGPMGNVDIDQYVARKSGKLQAKLLHPALDEVLKDTHGVIIYQEQVMKVANLVAGFSLVEADKLRRVMAKKVPELMAPMREKFVTMARKNHVPEKTANAVFDLIEPFAGYGFNKSHAAGYAVLSYQTAFLKANYPIEFMTAVLSSEIGSADKLRKFVAETRRMDLTLLGPDVNRSDYPFMIEARDPASPGDGGQRAIRFGLGGIKNLGQGVCEGIVRERVGRPYRDLRDFVTRTREFVNRKAAESLAMAGALDAFGASRQEVMEHLSDELERASSPRRAMLERQVSLFGSGPEDDQPPAAEPVVRNHVAGKDEASATHGLEKSALGFYLSGHPMDDYRVEVEALRCRPIEDLTDVAATPAAPGERPPGFAIAGVITSKRFRTNKNGQDYAVVQLEDLTGAVEVMVFARALEGCRRLIKDDEPVIVLGRFLPGREDRSSVAADTVYSLREARGFLRTLTIRCHADRIDEATLLQLRGVLERHPGRADVFYLYQDEGREKTVRVRDVKVMPSTRLVRELKTLPVVINTKVAGTLPK